MAELQIVWADGRREARELRRGHGQRQVVGDPDAPVMSCCELGTRARHGHFNTPYLVVSVRGAEVPFMMIATKKLTPKQLVFGQRG